MAQIKTALRIIKQAEVLKLVLGWEIAAGYLRAVCQLMITFKLLLGLLKYKLFILPLK